MHLSNAGHAKNEEWETAYIQQMHKGKKSSLAPAQKSDDVFK